MTWAKDNTLKLWPISGNLLEMCGYGDEPAAADPVSSPDFLSSDATTSHLGLGVGGGEGDDNTGSSCSVDSGMEFSSAATVSGTGGRFSQSPPLGTSQTQQAMMARY